jgi:hypothetical protein
MGVFDSMERRGVLDELVGTGKVMIPLRLRDLSRENDAVRYWVAEIESGGVSLIDGMVGCIEVLSEQNRKLRISR